MLDESQADNIEKDALDFMPTLKEHFGFSDEEIKASSKPDKR